MLPPSMAPRVPSHHWSHNRRVCLLWLLSVALFFALFRMALRNSISSPSSSSSSSSSASNADRRSKLYDAMARDLENSGAKFLNLGETSQSLSLSDIFTLKDGSISPVLKEANPAVRANVLYLSTEFSVPISEAVARVFGPHFDKCKLYTSAICCMSLVKNSSVYHFSMFHASHHVTPVPADEQEIEAEAAAVRAVSKELCPLNIVLERVVLTSTGVLLGCWQVVSGTEPISIRAKLRTALPRAPEKQLYDAVILHTSFARLLGPPKSSAKEMNNSDMIQYFHKLVSRLNKELNGFRATVSELWYVEEYDLLALALNGRMKVRRFQLGCSTD